MNKIINCFIGIWCGLVCFASPMWLTLIFLNMTGMIYKYDYSMDEGTALIIGLFLFILWILIGVIPNIYFGMKLFWGKKQFFIIYINCVILLCFLCLWMCNWNTIEFLMV